MRAVLIGGGVVGLCAAMMLAEDGHDVTVLERDPSAPPPPDGAWADWERRGVGQFRMLHYFQPRFRAMIDAELPGLRGELAAVGAWNVNLLDQIPPTVTGGRRDGDERFDIVTGRRPVMESVVAARADRTHGVTVRRGVGVTGLLAEPGPDGIPHVTGVRLADGEEHRADMVIDASGRRSAAPDWLRAIGSTGPRENRDDIGFRYYGRHYRSSDGALPPAFGPALMAYGSISSLALPADNGTWGMGIITSSRDRAVRALADNAVWERVVKSLPLVAHWIDAEPITDVEIMAKIEDRTFDYVVDGRPVVTGFLPLGDAWACTNPSVGRGIAIGALQAVALRELCREEITDGREQAVRWAELLAERAAPYVDDTLAFDRHRLAEMECCAEGRAYETEDPGWSLTGALMSSASRDPDLIRGLLEVASVMARGVEVLSRPGLAERAIALADPAPLPGPDRAELLRLVTI